LSESASIEPVLANETPLDHVPDIQAGEYTVIDLDLALERIDEPAAMEAIALLRQPGRIPRTPRSREAIPPRG
jgi:hypothetical protein